MRDMQKIWLVVALSAIAIALLLRLMMLEFDYNGLSYLAIVFGFCAVGVLQILSVWLTEKFRTMPDPVTYG